VSIRVHSWLPLVGHDHAALLARYRSYRRSRFFGFYSADLDGFTGIGHSIEDCLYKARWGMADYVRTLREQGLPVPTPNPNPTIVIQNDSKVQLA
jgi:hypothetical protein